MDRLKGVLPLDVFYGFGGFIYFYAFGSAVLDEHHSVCHGLYSLVMGDDHHGLTGISAKVVKEPQDGLSCVVVQSARVLKF